MTAILSVKNFTKTYLKKPVLNNLSFEVQTGRVVGLMGPNGAGKTTLLKALMGFLPLDKGKALVNGQPVGSAARANISFMPDKNHLFSWMRIRDAINYYKDMFNDFDEIYAQQLCEFLKLEAGTRVNQLSKGGLQRTLIMLTFARKSALYLLDEPIGGIDPLGRDKVLKTIFKGSNPESTIIIATQLVRDVEMLLDDVLFLNQGELIFNSSVDDIRQERGVSINDCYLEIFENV